MRLHRSGPRSAGGGSSSTARGRALGLLVWRFVGGRAWAQAPAGGVLDPLLDPEVRHAARDPAGDAAYAQAPPEARADPSTTTRSRCASSGSTILPASMGLEPTRVWSYGSVNHPGSFNYPAFTIEADWRRPVRVKWINGLVKPNGDFRPHLLPVDQTLHWANPPGGAQGRDGHGSDQSPYRGPVPIVTHLHGGHSTEESDGYPEAWYLPAARNIPAGYARRGSLYRRFQAKAQRELGQAWTPGSAVFQYDNDQRATTMWYHDHTLGMTRANVYAGPAGFYLMRGGPADAVPGTLPGPAPALGDPPGLRLLRDPDRDPGPLLHRGRRAVLPRQPCLLRGPRPVPAADPLHARPGLRRAERRRADLEPRVLRQRDRRQRRHLALARRAAAALSLPLPERLQLALPDPADVQRAAVLADRQRGRLPARAGRAARAAARPGGARRRDRRLHERRRSAARSSSRTSAPDEPFGGGVPASTSSRPTRARPGR